MEPEIKRFSDFYRNVLTSPTKLICPGCEGPIKVTVYTGFDMDKAGQAKFICTSCDLKMLVEAIR